MSTLNTKKLDNHKDFMDLEIELQSLLDKYPNAERIDVVYAKNSLNSMQLAGLELAYSNSPCKVIHDDKHVEFETYFRVQFDRLGICTWNEITPMSVKDKEEERGINMLEEDRQSNF